jgi:hypothetical protein
VFIRTAQKTLLSLTPFRIIPLFGWYVSDVQRVVNAATHSLGGAQKLLEAISPYADILGLEGDGTFLGGTAQERVANAIQALAKASPQLNEVAKESGDKDIILMGDMNNVSKYGVDEFRPLMESLNYYWATSELAADSTFSNYWQPDYEVELIKGSLIDQIFISADAKMEYIPESIKNGGMCADGVKEYSGESIPEYHRLISDHCPVWGSFRADIDND